MINRWQELYKQKLTSPEEAARLINSGDLVVAPLSNGQPLSLVNAVAKRIREGEIEDITYVSGVDVRWFDLYHPDLVGKVTIDTGFVSPATRQAVGQGLFTYTPCRLGEAVEMVSKCRNCNVSTLVVSPMDKHGF
ncbi:MAG: acetyl-CoA hydrolase, partial [Syntrophomonadaceae bacterium]|nr:acetyl-CoA hydrolase [Syntrophomonadaceae bacterium]